MSRNRKRWYLLYKWENRQRIFLYEPLSFRQLNCKVQFGWKVIDYDIEGLII